MSEYIALKDYARHMEIQRGDIIFISSDAKVMLWDAVSHGAEADLNPFIDGLLDAVGTDGAVIFPTYNWGFCQGETFDIRKTPCKTGTLGTLALKRGDFRRTKHPIYSFAVSGACQDALCQMTNADSFGLDSPFAFFKERGVINYVIDVSLKNCFTFTHFVEEHSGVVRHRFIKNFRAGYIDENGQETTRTYSMFVRDLDMDVVTTIDPIEADFLARGAEKRFQVNGSQIKRIDLKAAYDIMLADILNNRSRKLCSYKGQ